MGIIISDNLVEYEAYIKERLKHKRYIHSLGVSFTAASLAMRYSEDLQSSRIAGLLHDVAKCYTPSELLDRCTKASIDISSAERNNPELLHAKYGEYIAHKKLGINDANILSAIRFHTTGRADMCMLEKIIFVADFIEPNRSSFEGLDLIRQEAFVNIDRSIVLICESTLSYLDGKKMNIDSSTLDTYNYYKNHVK